MHMTICSRLRSCRIVRSVILPASLRILSRTFWQWHRLLKPEETDPFSWHLTSMIFDMEAIKKPKCLGMTNFICLLSASALFVRFASTYTVAPRQCKPAACMPVPSRNIHKTRSLLSVAEWNSQNASAFALLSASAYICGSFHLFFGLSAKIHLRRSCIACRDICRLNEHG